jgi:cell division protein FtsB
MAKADILNDLRNLLTTASSYISMGASLMAEIEETYATVKNVLSKDDDAAVRAVMDQLHADTNNLTAQINALRDS